MLQPQSLFECFSTTKSSNFSDKINIFFDNFFNSKPLWKCFFLSQLSLLFQSNIDQIEFIPFEKMAQYSTSLWSFYQNRGLVETNY
jgi:hypothetical protein